MRIRLAVLCVVSSAMLLPAAGAYADSSASRTNVNSFTDFTYDESNPCDGDWITVTGINHRNFVSARNSNGFNQHYIYNYQGATGTGQSGTVYRVQLHATRLEKRHSAAGTRSNTYVDTLRYTATGSTGTSFVTKRVTTYTTDRDGQTTVTTSYDQSCL